MATKTVEVPEDFISVFNNAVKAYEDLKTRAEGAKEAFSGHTKVLGNMIKADALTSTAIPRAIGEGVGSAIIGGKGFTGSISDTANQVVGNAKEGYEGAKTYLRGMKKILTGEGDAAPAAPASQPTAAAASQPTKAPSGTIEAALTPVAMPTSGGTPPVFTESLTSGGAESGAPSAPSASSATMPSKAASAMDESRMASLFKTANGSDFDPNSRVDRQKMAQLRSLLQSNPDLANKSDTKIALAWYRTMK